jgi:hypothetical protein
MAGTGGVSQDGEPSADMIAGDIEGCTGVQVRMDLLPLLQGSPFWLGQIPEMGPFSIIFNGVTVLVGDRNHMVMMWW